MTAVVSKEWKQRMLIISGALFAMGAWFLFDGLVAYPNNNVRALAYAELEKLHGEESPELAQAWTQVAKENGWLEEKPKKLFTSGQIRTQVILALLTWGAAGATLLHFFRSLSQTTRFEGGTLHLPDGRGVALNTIRGLSKRRWQSRSIADFVYEPESGIPKRFILDDYKFIGVAEILKEVEKSLPPDICAPSPPDKRQKS